MSQLKQFAEDSFEKVEKGLQSQLKTVAQSVKGQVAGSQQAPSDQQQLSPEQTQEIALKKQKAEKATADMWQQILAPSNPQEGKAKEEPSAYQQKLVAEGKSPEEIQQLLSLRKKLHDETYYIPLTQRKPHVVEQKEEEQKKENEKMESLQKDEEKKKKGQSIAVQMGANRAEQFPGASG